MNARATLCPSCGQALQPGARFCPNCGEHTTSAPTVPSVKRDDRPATLIRASDAGVIDALRKATLGEYEIIGLLGRGGMATVYLAHDIALDRRVAIKVMAPHLLAGEGMAERFKREARTAGSLSHPHIIPIYAVKQAGDLLYFVMKFVEGRPLDRIIQEVGALPFAMAQTIMQQVGSALGYAHRRGIIHRDIKPANIMLDVDGWAMVTDFGIAKVSDKQGLTMTGATVGTPSYMSPEQCAATKELTPASDQYSLGVVAYEMIAGRLPFNADSVMAIMYSHYNDPPVPIEAVRPGCPPAIAGALMRMLEKEPEKRWPTVEAAVAAFGGAPLAPDDPIRTQMMTLANSGGVASQLVAKFSTPTSPTPAGKSPISKSRKGVADMTSGGVVGLALIPERVSVAVGGAVQLTARPKRASGATLFGRVITWASTDTDVATVSDDGLVAAHRPGAATITCTCEGASATAIVVVKGEKKSRVPAYVAGLVMLALVAAAAWMYGPWSTPAAAPPPSVQPALAPPPPAPQPTDSVSVAAPPPAPPPVLSRPVRRPVSEQVSTVPPPAPPPASEPVPASVVSDVQPAAPPPAAAAVPAPAPAPLPPPPPPPQDQRPLIEAVIQSYGRALESGEVQQVRRVYPGLTPQQTQVWRDFFGMVSGLKVDLAIKQLLITGDAAEAQVEGFSQFTQNHRQERQPMTFHTTLERVDGTWRIASIR